jgi:hypothetical protein
MNWCVSVCVCVLRNKSWRRNELAVDGKDKIGREETRG